jgi:hypothetical protein
MKVDASTMIIVDRSIRLLAEKNIVVTVLQCAVDEDRLHLFSFSFWSRALTNCLASHSLFGFSLIASS